MTAAQIEGARREFLDECEMVVKVPLVWTLDQRDGQATHGRSYFLPLPRYTYVGIRSSDSLHVSLQTPPVYPQPAVTPDSRIYEARVQYFLEHTSLLLGAAADLKKSHFNIWVDIPDLGLRYRGGFENGLETALSIAAYTRQHRLAPKTFNDLVASYTALNRAQASVPTLPVAGQPSPSTQPAHVALLRAFNDLATSAWRGWPSRDIPSFQFVSPAFLCHITGNDSPHGSFLLLKWATRSPVSEKREFVVGAADVSITKHRFTPGQHVNIVNWPQPLSSETLAFGDFAGTLWEHAPDLNPLELLFRPAELLKPGDSLSFDFSWVELDPRTPAPLQPDDSIPEVQMHYPFTFFIGSRYGLTASHTMVARNRDAELVYSSIDMGWVVEGARLLEKREYRMRDNPRPSSTSIASTVAEPSPPRSTAPRNVFARMWTNKTRTNGEAIQRATFAQLDEKKASFDIFVIDRGEFRTDSYGTVFFTTGSSGRRRCEQVSLRPLEYRILVTALKGIGVAGDALTLAKECWPDPSVAANLESQDTEDKDSASGRVRQAAKRLDSVLDNALRVRFRTFRKRKYLMSPVPSFCLVQLSRT